MRPHFIILVRHGESEGNADETKRIYETTADWKMNLTDTGKEQATKAGHEIMNFLSHYHVSPEFAFYISPWYRTRQTAKCIMDVIHTRNGINASLKEDPRIREQEWGNYLLEAARAKIDDERDRFGTFFYRMQDGESGADVYDRVSSFLDTFHRDFEKDSFPDNAVIVTHGLTLRLFLMRWFHWTVEEFERLANPANCSVVILERLPKNNRYRLVTQMVKKEAK